MNKRIKPSDLLLKIAVLALIAMLYVSCSKDSGDDSEPQIPSTPVADSDWQSVPASGDIIEKDSITIVFPTGSFSKETKVAITEVQKGEMCGSDEASKFYQITMPATVHKSITMKIKSSKMANAPVFATFSQGYRKSSGIDLLQNLNFDAFYDTDGYILSIPASENGDDAGNLAITVGLASSDQSNARTRSTAAEGKEGNIEWYFDYAFKLSSSQKRECKAKVATYNKYIKEAIKQIHDLGFSINTPCKIPFVFDILYKDWLFTKDTEVYGNFVQNGKFDEWNSIELNVNVIFSADETTMKQTFIHEILHYFQSHYDPRWAYNKRGGEDDILAEGASVWAEQFMNNGKMNVSFVEKYLPLYLVSFKDLDMAYSKDNITKGNKSLQYRHTGYAMSTMLYYLTTPECHKKMGWDYKSLGIDKTKIVDIFKLWKDCYGETYRPLERWLKQYCGFMDTDQYDSYILCMLTGNLLDGVNVESVGFPEGHSSRKADIKSNDIKEFEGNCYSYGCAVSRFGVFHYTNEKDENSLKGKSIIIKHQGDDLTTYVIAESKNKSFKLLDGKITNSGEIVISGDDLETMFSQDRTAYLYTVTINRTNTIKAYPFKVSCEIKDVEKSNISKVEIEKLISHFKMTPIVQGSYAYQGPDKRNTKGIYNYTISQAGDAVHIVGTRHEETGTSKMDESISFDILGATGNYLSMKIQNLKYDYKFTDSQEIKDDNFVVASSVMNFELTDLSSESYSILVNKDSDGRTSVWARFSGKRNAAGGLKVTSAYYKREEYSYGKKKIEECSGVEDYEENSFIIELTFWP